MDENVLPLLVVFLFVLLFAVLTSESFVLHVDYRLTCICIDVCYSEAKAVLYRYIIQSFYSPHTICHVHSVSLTPEANNMATEQHTAALKEK